MSWHGNQEKKWAWYKHTKPCNYILNKEQCPNTNCNYAHTLNEYMAAIQKRNFNLDFNIINQFTLLNYTNISNKRSYDSFEEPSSKKMRLE